MKRLWWAWHLYPQRCPFCDEVTGSLSPCPACQALLAPLEYGPYRLSPNDHTLHLLAGAASVYRYEGPVRQAILRVKYGGRASYCTTLGLLMAKQLFGCTFTSYGGIIVQITSPPAKLGYDLIVPVPTRNKTRGFNPPQRLAAVLARALGLPLVPEALQKVRSTPQQEGLGRYQRLTNLYRAFAADPALLPHNARVLLVDDVITTGATVSACADALLRAGAGEVFAVSLAATPAALPAEETASQSNESSGRVYPPALR